ncbi:organic cation transporter protein-like [Anneissia japonica]|uniref:organic cation transporter protein-like n=1 Tax=Anneissia japonica TaxID=1529436 RepID=UPI0014254D58|nr:organic cation transporter protein-like [Anneissia japonica]
MLFNRFSIVLVYYGLTYGVEGLNVNVYIGTFLGGLTEAFAYLFTWFIIQKFGRRLMLGGTLMTGGIACFVNIWIPSSFVELRTATAMIGKFFITSAFSIVYIYTVELFPTDIRTFGLGFCSSVSRVAGVLAPQILFLQKLWTHLPLVAFSVTSVTAGLFAFLLPETLNVPLPQTIEEAELIKRTNKQTSRGFHDTELQPATS